MVGSTDSGQLVYPRIDTPTRSMVVMTTEHHEAHEGEAFSATSLMSAIAAAASAYLELRVPGTKYVHLKPIFIQTDGAKWTLQLLESPTIGTPGTVAVPAYNRNRNSANSPGLAIYNNPATISAGTIIDQDYVGASTGLSVATSNDPNSGEWILVPGVKYLIKATNNGAGASTANLKLNWYEEPATVLG